MLTIIGVTLAITALGFVIYKAIGFWDVKDAIAFSFFYALIGVIVGGPLVLWLLHFEGLNQSYGHGRIVGHLVSVEEDGVFWKSTHGYVKYGEHQDMAMSVDFTDKQAAELRGMVGAYVD